MKNFGEGWMDPNTYHHEESYELACLAAGGGLLAANLTFDENKFIDKLELFNFSPNFRRVNLTKEEYEIAKRIKKENREIGFYDIIHMLLAKQTNSILITRDSSLIRLAKEYQIIVKKPEEKL